MTPRETVAARYRTARARDGRNASRRNALSRYDDKGNGRITSARRAATASRRCRKATYRYMQDGDGDGVGCE